MKKKVLSMFGKSSVYIYIYSHIDAFYRRYIIINNIIELYKSLWCLVVVYCRTATSFSIIWRIRFLPKIRTNYDDDDDWWSKKCFRSLWKSGPPMFRFVMQPATCGSPSFYTKYAMYKTWFPVYWTSNSHDSAQSTKCRCCFVCTRGTTFRVFVPRARQYILFLYTARPLILSYGASFEIDFRNPREPRRTTDKNVLSTTYKYNIMHMWII